MRQRVRAGAALFLGDVVLVSTAWAGALMLRYDGAPSASAWNHLLGFLPIVLVVTLSLHTAAGLYSGVLRFASVLEAQQVLVAQFITLCALLPLVYLLHRPVPMSVPVIAAVLACGGAGATRFWSRLLHAQHGHAANIESMLVVGGGEAGGALVRSVNSQHGARVSAVLDDDRRLWGRRIYGVRVEGGTDELAAVAERTGATRVVLAVSNAGPDLVRRLAQVCGDLGVGLSVVPTPSELLGRQVSLQDVRDLDITDLLGRAQVETDLEEITELIRGRRVLVTGGGGSIGAELGRQVAIFGPARLVLLDHDETHLFDAAASIDGRAVQRLADIRDEGALLQVFEDERPDVVFHAAAHKHVPLLEAHPAQAAETNILGTGSVLACATRVGVSRFVFISTDKAVRPSSVMGATKLVGEQLVLGSEGTMTTCAVRFGNVLGSRGSVVPTFVEQIRAGGPVTITDGRMTRYFMSIPEAVRLVLHAAALSRGGEIFMLDMGEPVPIIDLAKRMIQLSGQRPGADIEVRVTHMRPGEKLVEELHTPDERQHQTSHPSIIRLDPVRVPAPTLMGAVAEIGADARRHDDEAVRRDLDRLLSARGRLGSATIPAQRTLLRTVAE